MSDKEIVLIVDDDIDFLDSHKILLEQSGFTTITAESRKEAEELLEKTRPNVAIIDLMMEEPDGGFVLAHHLKRKYPDVPVIIASSVTSETGLEFDEGTGEGNSWVKADAILSKPLRFEEIQAVLKRFHEKSKA